MEDPISSVEELASLLRHVKRPLIQNLFDGAFFVLRNMVLIIVSWANFEATEINHPYSESFR